MNDTLLSYREALEKIRGAIRPLPAQTVSWRDSLYCVTASSVKAAEDSPPFDNSAVDGYAVRAADVAGADEDNPAALRVVEEIFAGPAMPAATVRPGEAARIMTGAPLPDGADAVVMTERARRENGRVLLFASAAAGENIRPRGEEIRRGDPLLSKGTRICAAVRGLLASQGILELPVRRPPRAAVLATGDEIVEPEEKSAPAQIRNANGYTLAAELERMGCPVVSLGIGPDDPGALKRLLTDGFDRADMLIASGGVSAGGKDYLPGILAELGMETVFRKVAVKPGKPLLFGICGGKPVFGLPGNPVSTLVTHHLFVKPAIRLMTGRSDWENPVWYARAGEPMRNPGNRANFIRCEMRHTPTGMPIVFQTANQGSGMLTSMAGAHGFAVIPADVDEIGDYHVLEFIPLDAM